MLSAAMTMASGLVPTGYRCCPQSEHSRANIQASPRPSATRVIRVIQARVVSQVLFRRDVVFMARNIIQPTAEPVIE